MNPVISDLAKFAMQHEAGPRLTAAISRFGSALAKSLTMRVLSWLRDNSRPRVSPGRLNRRVPPSMPGFVQVVPGLAEIVTVIGGSLCFSAGISQSEREDIARQGYEMYKPQVSVTYIVQPTSKMEPAGGASPTD